MKEKILEWLSGIDEGNDVLADKITTHLCDFFEWIIFDNDSPFWYEMKSGQKTYFNEIDEKYYTLEDVYQYWLKNVL